ncbi:MAG: hypothetical protein E7423_03360 [Ruminococcaceae bacterium]|nr:hypothetical protein [Oscillospiraceae bacterium]
MAIKRMEEDGLQAVYESPYQDRIDRVVDKLTQRERFSYDYASDPLYQAYAEAYQREGRRAAEDAVGLAAQNTGGRASSYAVTAAQQAGSYYASKQADKIPELYKLAYEVYRDEYESDLDLLDSLNDLDKASYSRWSDEREAERKAEQTSYQRELDELDRALKAEQLEYQRGRDALKDERYESEQAYKQQRDQVKDSQFERQQALREQKAAATASRQAAKTAKPSGAKTAAAAAKSEPADVQVYGLPGLFTKSEAEHMISMGVAEKVRSGGRKIYKLTAVE